MREISIAVAKSILGCGLCRSQRGKGLGCEYYTDKEITTMVSDQLNDNIKELGCDDSFPRYTVSRQEALDIVKQ